MDAQALKCDAFGCSIPSEVISQMHAKEGRTGKMLSSLHTKMLSTINAAHGFVCDDIGGCARREYAAVTDDIRMIANAERLAHIVIGPWNANIAPLQKADDFLDFQYRNRINPGNRFIQKNEFRVCR